MRVIINMKIDKEDKDEFSSNVRRLGQTMQSVLEKIIKQFNKGVEEDGKRGNSSSSS